MRTLEKENLNLPRILSDPVLFTRKLLFPLHQLFKTPDLEADLEPWQEDWLRAEGNLIGNATRQGGKTKLTMIKVIWKALTSPNSLHLVYASQDQVKDDMFAIHETLEMLDKNLQQLTDSKVRLVPLSDAVFDIILPNKARILGRAVGGKKGEAVRGKSAPDTIVLDECRNIPDPTFLAIYPMMAANPISQLIMISTPGSEEGFYFEEWTSAWKKRERIIRNGVASKWAWKTPDYTIFKVPWWLTLHVDKDKVERAREKYGEPYVEREFECKFQSGSWEYFKNPEKALNSSESYGSLDIPSYKTWKQYRNESNTNESFTSETDDISEESPLGNEIS